MRIPNPNVDRDPDGNIEPDNTFRVGNPFVAFHYQGKKNQFSYRVGAGVAIPVASLSDDVASRVTQSSAYYLAAALRGGPESSSLPKPQASAGRTKNRRNRAV